MLARQPIGDLVEVALVVLAHGHERRAAIALALEVHLRLDALGFGLGSPPKARSCMAITRSAMLGAPEARSRLEDRRAAQVACLEQPLSSPRAKSLHLLRPVVVGQRRVEDTSSLTSSGRRAAKPRPEQARRADGSPTSATGVLGVEKLPVRGSGADAGPQLAAAASKPSHIAGWQMPEWTRTISRCRPRELEHGQERLLRHLHPADLLHALLAGLLLLEQLALALMSPP